MITYADQVREADQAPLDTLADFCEASRETISGVHILPFCPSSSDDGFAVTDYFAVDPAFEHWEDVARLGQSLTSCSTPCSITSRHRGTFDRGNQP